jgi:hypothetical protein
MSARVVELSGQERLFICGALVSALQMSDFHPHVNLMVAGLVEKFGLRQEFKKTSDDLLAMSKDCEVQKRKKTDS